MSAADVLALERMGFRFRMEDGRVTRRCYGQAPPEAADLLARVTREDVITLLRDRAAGFTPITDVPQAWAPAPADAAPPLRVPRPPESADPGEGPPEALTPGRTVAVFGPILEAAVLRDDGGAAACRAWAVILDVCMNAYNAGDPAGALAAVNRLEAVERSARLRKENANGYHAQVD